MTNIEKALKEDMSGFNKKTASNKQALKGALRLAELIND